MKDAQTLWSKISADVLDKMSSCKAVQLKAQQRAQDKYEMDKESEKAIAREEGLAEGEHKKAIETAKKMLADGLSIDMVSNYTGLSEAMLNKIQV